MISIILYIGFQIAADPKLVRSIALLAFELVCAYFACHYTITQTTRFLKNADTSSIDTKPFNESPDDPYPSLTMCIVGAELRWFNDATIFERFEVNPSKYGELLKGKEVLKYQYDYQTRLYNQLPLDIRNGSNEGFEDFSLSITNVITGLEFVTEDEQKSIHYGKGSRGKKTERVPFEVNYTTPDTVCFTSNAIDSSKTIRTLDWMLLNQSIFGNDLYRNVNFKLYFHYPGQLLRTFHNPILETNVLLGNKNNEEKFWDKVFKIKIEEVTVLRKRPNSNIPCKNHLNKLDDVNYMETIMKSVGCMPIYWQDIRGLSMRRECESPSELKQIYQHIQNYKDILVSYDSPCVEMSVATKLDEKEENKWDEPQIKVIYTKATYQNIENSESFNDESFLSGVGGFIGIFLGYSILQIPELLGSVFARLRNIKLMGSKTNAVKPKAVKKRKRGKQQKGRPSTSIQTQLNKLLKTQNILLKGQVETQKQVVETKKQVVETQKQGFETQKQVVETQNKGIETQNQVEKLQNAILEM